VLYAIKTAELSQNMTMPKLSNSPAIYPQHADILPSTYGIPPEDPWHLLRLRRNSNFKVSSQLKACGFTHSIPTRAIERQWSNRMGTAQVPLSPRVIYSANSAQATVRPYSLLRGHFGHFLCSVTPHVRERSGNPGNIHLPTW
jgi:hypothetical protein